ncbi:Hsp20/alpha crystallin family protein [Longispora sp. K20-0274]|uniref:Hsp20/alpha crystallin family protein n=1 Tax=Longispora sp. K20-0274 TaxID=3088255 RepID=UPI00399985D6
MASLRFDPFRELERWTNEVMGATRAPRMMPLDAYQEGESYVLAFDLPGVDESSLTVTAENNTLTVTAERRAERPEGSTYLVAERPIGTYQRQIMLADGLDLDAINARYTDGVLTVTIPVAEQAKPRAIAIERGSQQEGHRMITGESADTGGTSESAVNGQLQDSRR